MMSGAQGSKAYGYWLVGVDSIRELRIPDGVTVESFHIGSDPRHVNLLVSSEESRPEIGIYIIGPHDAHIPHTAYPRWVDGFKETSEESLHLSPEGAQNAQKEMDSLVIGDLLALAGKGATEYVCTYCGALSKGPLFNTGNVSCHRPSGHFWAIQKKGQDGPWPETVSHEVLRPGPGKTCR